MIRATYGIALALLYLLSNYYIKAEEAPKNIIVIEEEIENNLDIESNGVIETDNEDTNNIFSDENSEQKNLIVIDDIPKEFNQWYGVLSSEQGGLGWLMWGNTPQEYAIKLMRTSALNHGSPTLLKLNSNLLLSRAKKPISKKIFINEQVDSLSEDQLIYFKEKIKILSAIGDTENIKKLILNIPLEHKTELFEEQLLSIRNNDIDIPFICESILEKKFNLSKDLQIRKKLISCNIALKKFDEAELAISLLENDFQESTKFAEAARKFLSNESVKNIKNFSTTEINKQNLKIISLAEYEMAKTIFKDKTKELDKIIFDLELYSKEIQISALERLIQKGIYKTSILKEAYIEYYKNFSARMESNSINKSPSENPVLKRAKWFYLASNAVKDTEKAKYLNLLWTESNNLGIEYSIYQITKDIIKAIEPNSDLSWFIFPATKALLVSNENELAKKWLFFMSNDLINRASLDLNFCKYLIMLYIKDEKLANSGIDIPDIDFLLERLKSAPEYNKEEFFRILISLKSLEYKVPGELWNVFYMNDFAKIANNKENLNYLIFNLDEAVNNNNLAEAILIVLNLLNENNKNDFYYFYKAMNSLYKLGLKNYTRDYILEYNLSILK